MVGICFIIRGMFFLLYFSVSSRRDPYALDPYRDPYRDPFASSLYDIPPKKPVTVDCEIIVMSADLRYMVLIIYSSV